MRDMFINNISYWKSMNGKRVVVTGGAGFIGSHLVRELVALGAKVTVIDNEFSGRKDNLSDVLDKIDYKKIDICDKSIDLAKEIMGNSSEQVYCVFHEAAVASVPRSVADPMISFENNVIGMLRVLLACKKLGVRRVLFASSSSVYGDEKTMPKMEKRTGKTLSPYALTKHIGEEMMRQFYELYGLECVCLRYFNVFGPRQNPNGPYAAVIPLFINKMLSGENPVIFGDGKQRRDFTYVKNVVDTNVLFSQLPSEEVSGKTFNIACGGSIELISVVEDLNKILGTQIKPIFLDERKGDIKDSCADITLASSLGFKPSVSFFDGLKDTANYYKGSYNLEKK